MNATGSGSIVLTRTFYTDGSIAEQRVGIGTKGLSEARWYQEKLIANTKTEIREKFSEIYELFPSGNQLDVLVRVDNGPQSFFIRMVYDKQIAGAAARARNSTKRLGWIAEEPPPVGGGFPGTVLTKSPRHS